MGSIPQRARRAAAAVQVVFSRFLTCSASARSYFWAQLLHASVDVQTLRRQGQLGHSITRRRRLCYLMSVNNVIIKLSNPLASPPGDKSTQFSFLLTFQLLVAYLNSPIEYYRVLNQITVHMYFDRFSTCLLDHHSIITLRVHSKLSKMHP